MLYKFINLRSYIASLTKRAQNLRNNATKQERRLWFEFLRDFRPRFTRQRIVGSYILDFFCGKVKLAVELDGSQHHIRSTPVVCGRHPLRARRGHEVLNQSFGLLFPIIKSVVMELNLKHFIFRLICYVLFYFSSSHFLSIFTVYLFFLRLSY